LIKMILERSLIHKLKIAKKIEQIAFVSIDNKKETKWFPFCYQS